VSRSRLRWAASAHSQRQEAVVGCIPAGERTERPYGCFNASANPVGEVGTLGPCKHLLRDHPESYWVPILQSACDRQRLNWSVEAAALRPEFAALFTDEERAIAKRRLAAFGFDANG